MSSKSSRKTTTSRDRSSEFRNPREIARSFAADPQRIGDAVDVIEPRRDQRDLQDAAIVEAGGCAAARDPAGETLVASLVSLTT